MEMDTVQALTQQVLAQAASVAVIVSLLRLFARRLTGRDPSAEALLALNLAASALMTLVVMLYAGANFTRPATYGTLVLVALSVTIIAHGGYDLVATRAKGSGAATAPGVASIGSASASASAPAPAPAPPAAPTPQDFPPGVPGGLEALGLPIGAAPAPSPTPQQPPAAA